MKVSGYLKEGFKFCALPRFIGIYAAYIIISNFVAEYSLLVHIFATIFIEPLLFSYIAGRYFIDAVAPDRSSELFRVRRALYVPFIKIFTVLFLLTLCIQLAYSAVVRYDARVVYPLWILYGLLSTIAAFWMTATMFAAGNPWRGFRAAGKLAAANPGVILFLLIVYVVFKVLHEQYGLGRFQWTALLPFIALHGVYAVADLYVARVTVACAADQIDRTAARGVLDGYIAGTPVQEQARTDAVRSGRANVCLLLGILSLVPFVHFFALYFGWKRFRHHEYGRVRTMIGFVLGLFFTALYSLAFLGNVAGGHKRQQPVAHISSLSVYLNDAAVSPEVKRVIRILRAGGTNDYAGLAKSLETSGSDKTQARYFALGLAYSYARDARSALAAFATCLSLPSWSPEALFHIGRIHLFETGDYFEARTNLVKFLKYRPKDATARLYLELIDNRVAWDNNWVISFMSVFVLLIAMTLHEFGHSFAANACGDPSAKDAGRLSLNPIVHLDLLGSIILPAFLILSRSSIIVGWAKPVPVNAANFKDPLRDTAFVSFMGCCTNFLIAFAATIVLVLVSVMIVAFVPGFVSVHWLYPSGYISVAGLPWAKLWIYMAIFLSLLIMINIAIGIFNLIPIPPLDGAWLVERKLAPLLKQRYAAYQQFAFLLVLILLFANVIDVVIGSVLNAYFICLQVILAPALYLA